jgi:hypothetical protein
VASEAAEEKTPYELLGGDHAVRKLTADFYELMDTLPEAAPIRAMHKGDLTEMTDIPDRAERARPVAHVHAGRARQDLARRIDEGAADGLLWTHGRDVSHQRLMTDRKKG